MSSLGFTWRTISRRSRFSLLILVMFFAYTFYVLVFRRSKSSYTVTSYSSEGATFTLAVRDKTPPNYNLTVVLLHSENLDSTVWEDIKTLDILYKAGYRALAVDLPGHGNSRSYVAPKQVHERAVILETVLKELHATECILVAPSMGGTYALPVVVRGSLKLKGFVPISPFSYEKFQKGEYASLKIPTMIIYGMGDKQYGEASANILQTIPDSKVYVIKDASHACYVQQPNVFHEVLLTFLKEIETETFDSIRQEQVLKYDTF